MKIDEIQEGIDEYHSGTEDEMINKKRIKTERAKGLFRHILNNLPHRATFSRIWIERVYKSVDTEMFSKEEVKRLMKEKRVYDFMNYQISSAMEGYQ